MSKRLLLARTMENVGLTRFIEFFRSKPGILIINHHRIGDSAKSHFDRGVFSATVDQLNDQVQYLRRSFPVIGGEELIELVSGATPLKRLHVAITFDDGYLDNYANAFSVLRANNVSGFFFLVPEYVGTNAVPWWDEIAYLVRNCPKNTLELRTPTSTQLDLHEDREKAIHKVLSIYKRLENSSAERLVRELREAAECSPPVSGRRFLSWGEAAEMQGAGMTIGSHTMTHRILGQLPDAEQEQELVRSRQTIEQHLGCSITTLAYPVGSRIAFSATTEKMAQQAGYKVCMSFYGGVNRPGNFRPMNVLRTSVEPELLLFRNQVALMSRLGKLPYGK